MGKYSYKLVPLPSMFGVRVPPENHDGPGGRGDDLYVYPYDDLPPLVSHLHPKFAIFDAGRKLKMFGNVSNQQVLEKFYDKYPELQKVWNLYRAWTRVPPIESLEDESYNDPHTVLVFDDNSYCDDPRDGDCEDRTNRTKEGRGDGFYLRPRTQSVLVVAAEGNDNLNGGVNVIHSGLGLGGQMHETQPKANRRSSRTVTFV